MPAAEAALVVALAAAVLGAGEASLLLALLVFFTVASSWATFTHAFALKYFRQYASGDRFEFDFAEEPRFVDILATAVMISSAGAVQGGTPQARRGFAAVRTHVLISYVFNAFVVATTVSLAVGFISVPRS